MLQTLSNTGSRHIARSDDAFMNEPIVIGTKVFVRDIVEVWRSGARLRLNLLMDEVERSIQDYMAR